MKAPSAKKLNTYNNNSKFKDNLKVKDLRFNYTSTLEYFRSPLVPDNQKVLFALLLLKRKNKIVIDLSNSYIAEFLNKIGMYSYEYYQEDFIDPVTGEYHKKGSIKASNLVYKRVYFKDDKTIEEPLYTISGVSNAIKKWEDEGLLSCTYFYDRNNDPHKSYKYDTTRYITLDIDKIRMYLSVFTTDSETYKALPVRSRRRKLIRQRPISVCDAINEALASLSEELKARYQTATGLFTMWCYSFTAKYCKSQLKLKPSQAQSLEERQAKYKASQLDADVGLVVHGKHNKKYVVESKSTTKTSTGLIKMAMDMVK